MEIVNCQCLFATPDQAPMTPLEQLQNALADFRSQKLNSADISRYAIQSIYPCDQNRFQCMVVSLQKTGPKRAGVQFQNWIVVLFRSKQNPNVGVKRPASAEISRWAFCQDRTDAFAKLVAEHIPSSAAQLLVPACHVFGNQQSEVALGIVCDQFQLVAKLLSDFGPPPASVVHDWQIQLARIHSSSNESPTPSETLVTEDGSLIPFWQMIAPWRTQFEQAFDSGELGQLPTAKSVVWPWPTAALPKRQTATVVNPAWVIDPAGAVPSADTPKRIDPKKRRSPTGRPNKSNHFRSRPLVVFAIACSTFLLIGTLWVLRPRTEQSPSASTQPNHANHQGTSHNQVAQREIRNDIDQESLNDSSEPPNREVEGVEDLTTLSLDDPSALRPLAPESDSVEALLAQLQPTSSSFKLDLNTNTTSIIRDAFRPMEKEIVEPEIENDAADLETIPAAEASNEIEKHFALVAASSRERLLVASPVNAKEAMCEIQFQVSPSLVIEPAEPIVIIGNNKAQWRLGIEDEQPELWIELESKPGRRWTLSTAVGLRESALAPVVPFGPSNATLVGNRLVDYNQWINDSIAMLEVAKSAPRRRSRIDFVGEIKKLERQQREAEEAIKRWRIILRLSHLFFDDNHLHVKLSSP